MASLLLLGAFVHFIKGAIMLLFLLTSFLLVTVVLLQEGKGGGLAGAFGGAGAETFGVQTGGVNKFTFWIAGVFMTLAIVYATIKPDEAPLAPSARESGIAAPDDGCSDDGASDDAGSEDTGSDDTGSEDTGSEDAGSGDSGSGDAGSEDSGAGDTGDAADDSSGGESEDK